MSLSNLRPLFAPLLVNPLTLLLGQCQLSFTTHSLDVTSSEYNLDNPFFVSRGEGGGGGEGYSA